MKIINKFLIASVLLSVRSNSFWTINNILQDILQAPEYFPRLASPIITVYDRITTNIESFRLENSLNVSIMPLYPALLGCAAISIARLFYLNKRLMASYEQSVANLAAVNKKQAENFQKHVKEAATAYINAYRDTLSKEAALTYITDLKHKNVALTIENEDLKEENAGLKAKLQADLAKHSAPTIIHTRDQISNTDYICKLLLLRRLSAHQKNPYSLYKKDSKKEMPALTTELKQQIFLWNETQTAHYPSIPCTK